MLILASNSPRRREICELLNLKFEIIPAENESPLDLSLPREKAVEAVAVSKAEEVFNKNPLATVIGSDTAVLCDGTFLGKPENEDDAKRMLKMLSGKRHQVLTGVAIISRDKRVSFCEVAQVEFQSLSDEEILWYISTKEPMDKAGAYAVQGKGARFVKKIDGDFYTVMGLPCQRLYEELKNFRV